MYVHTLPNFNTHTHHKFKTYTHTRTHTHTHAHHKFKTHTHMHMQTEKELELWREAEQRNGLIRGLAEAQPNDLVILSDVDEIPRAVVIAQLKRCQGEREIVVVFKVDIRPCHSV